MSFISILDVANWFLAKEPMTAKKLQKMCYYAYAWSLVILDKPIFNDTKFEAWKDGPASPKLYHKYKNVGWNPINPQGDRPTFKPQIEGLLEQVWATYGDKRDHQLESLSKSEMPWQNAREGLSYDKASKQVLADQDMKDYYRKIFDD